MSEDVALPATLKDAVLNGSGTVFSNDRLQELAADESNRVYDYVHDPVDRILPAKEVELKLKVIWGYTVSNRNTTPGLKWADQKKFIEELANHPDEQVRRLELHKMAKTHPRMYNVVTHPKSDYFRDVKPLFEMTALKHRVESGMLSEKRAMQELSTGLQNHFKLDPGKTQEDTTPWDVSSRPD